VSGHHRAGIHGGFLVFTEIAEVVKIATTASRPLPRSDVFDTINDSPVIDGRRVCARAASTRLYQSNARAGYHVLMEFNTANPCILTATCASRMGTTAAVTGFLAEHRLYIMEMQQFDDVLTRRFFVRVTFCGVAGETLDLGGLRTDFLRVATAEQMQWAIHDGTQRTRVMILVSRLDHCLEDLLYRHRTGELLMDITAIVSNHPDMQSVADLAGIPYYLMPVTAGTKALQEAHLLKLVDSTHTELVVLARYMQIFSDDICRRLHGRAVNIHHSFLPGFKGAKPYHQAHARGVKLIGATAHYVTGDLDEGPIIEQIVERVDHTFTPEMLTSAGRDSERRALSTAVRLLLEHRVFLDDHKTVVFK
jgi:formyltetrahydrofolate deformylase